MATKGSSGGKSFGAGKAGGGSKSGGAAGKGAVNQRIVTPIPKGGYRVDAPVAKRASAIEPTKRAAE